MRNDTINKIMFDKIEFVMTRISGEVERAMRVQEDITSKPPTTTEWK
ncbi:MULTISPECIES: hypothetical protein [Kurthia]|uniref:GMP synthase C-terminal domain-containing protein n=1 Tax=Kurthia populi TaxID=1562132 RepID=A0ABW5Y457_9BACL|nr:MULTISPECIES: hypothetical protein [unclassified Kurthia]HIX43220.1 hypothetical protein [Candidatus Kurthia intestinigallinarum]